MNMNELTLKEKVAAMLLVGIPNKESIEKVLKLIENYGIGGVILYKNNYQNLEELKELITKLKNANKNNKLPLTIAIDQEGGRVNRLPNDFVNSLSLHNMAKNTNEDIKLFAATTSKLLENLGINMNLAPVVDLKKFEDNHAIGNRAISDDVNKVTEVAQIITKEYQNNNVVSVIKHFPGQGSLSADSHFILPIISNYNKILNEDILPFQTLIDQGIDAIMIGHILIKGKTNLHPASLSKEFINKELMERMNYKNIIMTDELDMKSVAWLYGKKNAIVKAFHANNDIICCKYHDRLIERVLEKVVSQIEKEKISIKEIDASIQKIEHMKKKYHFNDHTNFDAINIEEYNKIIVNLNKKVVTK